MINLEQKYTPRINPGDADYPFGSIKGDSSPGAGDGTPLSSSWGNDIEGFRQAVMTEAGVTPSGQPDNAHASQLWSAMKDILRQEVPNMGWTPVEGSFELGGTITARNQILWWEAAKAWYSWQGDLTISKIVPPGSTPASAGGVASDAWVDRTDGALRGELPYIIYSANGTTDAAGLQVANAAAIAASKSILINGIANVESPVVLTATIADTVNQIFTITSQVTVAAGQSVRPEWFGDVEGSVDKATKVLPSSGGTVLLRSRRYKKNNHVYNDGIHYMSNANVRIIGEKMPWFNHDCSALENGSIIEDMFLAWAPNLELVNVGFDSGKAFCDANYGGSAREGLVATYPSEAIKNSGAQLAGFKTHNIVALCNSPDSPVHAMILGEGYTGVRSTGETVGMFGFHGVVFKNTDVITETVTAYCNGGEGVIAKSDNQASAMAYNIQIGSVLEAAEGPAGHIPHTISTSGMGVMLNPAGNNIDGIRIGNVVTSGHPVGVGTNISTGKSLREIIIGDVRSKNCQYPVVVDIPAGSFARQLNIGDVYARGAVDVVTVNSVDTALNPVGIGGVHGEIASGVCINIGGKASVVVDKITSESVSTAIVRNNNGRIKIGSISKQSGSLPLIDTTGGTGPALANGWTQVAGNDAFGLVFDGYKYTLKGLVRPGSSNVIGSIPLWAAPASTKRFSCLGAVVDAQAPVGVAIGTAGEIVVNEIGGGVANCTQWLSLDCSWEV